jgi:spore coat polysaccharide biosynthesis protein SpsF (cytidylyltransferase family)
VARTVIIAQARTGSTRLPGKVLALVAGRPIVEHVLCRAMAVGGADAVCLATTDLAADDGVAEIGRRLGAAVVRGSASDVLGRYALAARETRADIVMRLTCDCPLIDPEVCAAVLALRHRTSSDYAANVIRRDWPQGLDCEAFTAAFLAEAAARATEPYDREHVTPWIRRHAPKQANLEGPGAPASEQRWVVDYPEDLEFVRAVMDRLPPWPALPGWRAVLAVLEREPGLLALNAARRESTLVSPR